MSQAVVAHSQDYTVKPYLEKTSKQTTSKEYDFIINGKIAGLGIWLNNRGLTWHA